MSDASNQFDNTELLKEHHEMVTIWLVVLGIGSVASAGIYLYLFSVQGQYLALIIGMIGFVRLFFLIQIYNWKKYAFYGFVVSKVVVTLLVVKLTGDTSVSLDVVSLGILYAVLLIENKETKLSSWSQLE